MEWLNERDGGIFIHIHVQPRASRNEVVGIHGDALKVRLTSPPVEGAANLLLVKFIAKRLGLPRSKVRLVAGERSRQKTLQITGVSKDYLLKMMG